MKKKAITGVLTASIVVLLFAAFRVCERDSDAAGYVQANLDLVFQGEKQEAKKFVKASSRELEEMYENGVSEFASGYLIGDIDSEGAYTSGYEELVKQIFAVMRYQVGETRKTGEGTYQVTVTYQPSDVFTRFLPKLQAESDTIQKALNSGAYAGTKEEQFQAALRDYLLYGYETLEMSYLEMKYGEQESFTFIVKETKDGTLEVQNNGINTFIERILELDKL